jgi:hypothetical protein
MSHIAAFKCDFCDRTAVADEGGRRLCSAHATAPQVLVSRNQKRASKTLPTKDWWEYYVDGKIIRREDTPTSIIRTLEDWSDATCSKSGGYAMWEFANGKPVSPSKLQREISECIGSNTLEKERGKLRQLEIWAIREGKLAAATKELWEAQQEFLSAVNDAGVDAYHAHKLECGPASPATRSASKR